MLDRVPRPPMDQDGLPWAEHELQDMLCDHLASRHANMARWTLEGGYLEFTRREWDALRHFQTIDVVIKVGGEHNPATRKGRSPSWMNGRYTHDEEIAIRTQDALRDIFAGQEHVRLGELRFVEVSASELTELAGCRDALVDASATNQANVHPTSPARIVRAGLRFRSRAEVRVWNALIDNLEKGESVAPLPVVCEGRFERIEPDFLVFMKRKHLLIEVDGPRHQEDVSEGKARTDMLEGVGFEVWRVNVAEVSTPAKAEAWVRDVLERARAGTSRVTA